MADTIESLILEQLRALRNQIEGLQVEMRNEFGDVKHRINRLESAVAGVRRGPVGRNSETLSAEPEHCSDYEPRQ